MFTGIIQAVGKIKHREARGGDARLAVESGKLDLKAAVLGDSIAVNGVCLTAVALFGDGFAADVSRETLSLTTLGDLGPGSPVNLEKALTLSTPLGGHLVSGHVDGLGRILERTDDARSVRFRIEAPAELARYIAQKGSICVDGTSLTVNAVQGGSSMSTSCPIPWGRPSWRAMSPVPTSTWKWILSPATWNACFMTRAAAA